jgi:Chitobiase/beta-hexosaminidase C-terminal domain.
MRKTFILKSLLLLCALIAGSSSAWADYVEVYTLDGTIKGSSSNYAEASSITQNGMTWSVMGNTVTETWRFGGKSLDGVDRTITGQTKFAEALAQIIINHKGTSSDKVVVNSITLTVASDADFTDVIDEIKKTSLSIAKNTEGSIEFTPSAPLTEWAKDSYYKFTINITNPQSSNYAFLLKSIVFNKNAGGGGSVATPTISGNSPFLTSTDVTITCGTDGAAIQYSTDNGTSWNAYSEPFTLTATTTVKAKATKSGSTDSDEASKTFTKVTPMKVAAALTAIDALADNGTIADQCVAGIISQVEYYSSNTITYWISDDGTTTSQLEVYKGKGLNGANFTAKTDLNVGDQVTVYGTLKKFVKDTNTTPEFDQGSQLLSYSPTGTPVPAINASNVTIDSEATSGEITYTIDNSTGASLTAAVKSGDWISNVQVDGGNNKVTFTVTQNTGEQRIGYITLSYTGAADKDVKVTQKATYGTATLPFAFDGGKADIETTAGLTHTGLGDYDYSPKLKFDGTDDFLILKINGAAQKLYFDIKGNSFSGGTFKVQTSADGVTYTDLKSYTEIGAVSHESLDLASTVRYIKWIYANKSAGNVGIGRIGIDCEAAYIPSAGYATYTTPNNVDFTGTGVTAYKVSAIGADYVSLEEVTEAPAGTPLVLKATAGNYALNIVASAAAVTGNKLEVSEGTATTDDANTVYALASKGEPAVVGFYKVKAGVKVPAGKCYLSVAATSAREFYGFGDDATSINAVQDSGLKVNGEVYDLSGRRIQKPTKGLYIQNGKKVVIK